MRFWGGLILIFKFITVLIMGLGSNGGEDVVVDDGDGGGDGADCGIGGKSFGSVSCSICLETVIDNGDRSWAKLQCGHQFHLGESKLSRFGTDFVKDFFFTKKFGMVRSGLKFAHLISWMCLVLD